MRPHFATPLLWVIGFVSTFVIGGLSGIITASAPLDLQLHDTYFIVAYLHYALVGGAIFPLHIQGLEGMPRRVYTYGPEMGWGTLNLVATMGSTVAVLGGLVFVPTPF